MSQYLLATYMVEGGISGAPPTPEQMQAFMQRIIELEAEMDESGTFLFGGALHGPDAATVVASSGEDAVLTDGPLAAAEAHLAGFYIIEAADLDEALDWAKKVAHATGRPIEVRPFRATGRAKDHMPPG